MNIENPWKKSLLAASAAFLLGAAPVLSGCDEANDSAEEIGENIDDGADDASDALDDAADDASDAIDDAIDETEDALDDNP
ncbi:MAG: hypothetical protein CMJ31_01100 [Phycisphaerae bacterium]|nr:hypothetical protein [Phycisphaerae bacterium]|tara:strand:- start:245 stop:487 length:243 start_codon:yes stop_codon:yes gene_type:complete